MDNNFEFIQTVFIALLFIYIDVLIEILFDSLHFLFNILRNFTPSDVKWLFVRAVIVIVVVLILWEIREIYCIHLH